MSYHQINDIPLRLASNAQVKLSKLWNNENQNEIQQGLNQSFGGPQNDNQVQNSTDKLNNREQKDSKSPLRTIGGSWTERKERLTGRGITPPRPRPDINNPMGSSSTTKKRGNIATKIYRKSSQTNIHSKTGGLPPVDLIQTERARRSNSILKSQQQQPVSYDQTIEQQEKDLWQMNRDIQTEVKKEFQRRREYLSNKHEHNKQVDSLILQIIDQSDKSLNTMLQDLKKYRVHDQEFHSKISEEFNHLKTIKGNIKEIFDATHQKGPEYVYIEQIMKLKKKFNQSSKGIKQKKENSAISPLKTHNTERSKSPLREFYDIRAQTEGNEFDELQKDFYHSYSGSKLNRIGQPGSDKTPIQKLMDLTQQPRSKTEVDQDIQTQDRLALIENQGYEANEVEEQSKSSTSRRQSKPDVGQILLGFKKLNTKSYLEENKQVMNRRKSKFINDSTINTSLKKTGDTSHSIINENEKSPIPPSHQQNNQLNQIREIIKNQQKEAQLNDSQEGKGGSNNSTKNPPISSFNPVDSPTLKSHNNRLIDKCFIKFSKSPNYTPQNQSYVCRLTSIYNSIDIELKENETNELLIPSGFFGLGNSPTIPQNSGQSQHFNFKENKTNRPNSAFLLHNANSLSELSPQKQNSTEESLKNLGSLENLSSHGKTQQQKNSQFLPSIEKSGINSNFQQQMTNLGLQAEEIYQLSVEQKIEGAKAIIEDMIRLDFQVQEPMVEYSNEIYNQLREGLAKDEKGLFSKDAVVKGVLRTCSVVKLILESSFSIAPYHSQAMERIFKVILFFFELLVQSYEYSQKGLIKNLEHMKQFVTERKNLEDDVKYYRKVNSDLMGDLKGLNQMNREKLLTERQKVEFLTKRVQNLEQMKWDSLEESNRGDDLGYDQMQRKPSQLDQQQKQEQLQQEENSYNNKTSKNGDGVSQSSDQIDDAIALLNNETFNPVYNPLMHSPGRSTGKFPSKIFDNNETNDKL